MAERSRQEQPLNLDLVTYDDPGWTPIIGRASDSELMLDLPDGTLRPRSDEPRRTAPREFLANDFGFSQWS
jgi:hypothetical protein